MKWIFWSIDPRSMQRFFSVLASFWISFSVTFSPSQWSWVDYFWSSFIALNALNSLMFCEGLKGWHIKNECILNMPELGWYKICPCFLSLLCLSFSLRASSSVLCVWPIAKSLPWPAGPPHWGFAGLCFSARVKKSISTLRAVEISIPMPDRSRLCVPVHIGWMGCMCKSF